MGAFSGLKKEIETIVKLRVQKVIHKMNLVKRDEFEVLKKMVQKLAIANNSLKKKRRNKISISRKKKKKKKIRK